MRTRSFRVPILRGIRSTFLRRSLLVATFPFMVALGVVFVAWSVFVGLLRLAVFGLVGSVLVHRGLIKTSRHFWRTHLEYGPELIPARDERRAQIAALQESLSIPADGVVGMNTIAALHKAGLLSKDVIE